MMVILALVGLAVGLFFGGGDQALRVSQPQGGGSSDRDAEYVMAGVVRGKASDIRPIRRAPDGQPSSDTLTDVGRSQPIAADVNPQAGVSKRPAGPGGERLISYFSSRKPQMSRIVSRISWKNLIWFGRGYSTATEGRNVYYVNSCN